MDLRNLKNKKWYPNTVALCAGVTLWFLLNNIGILGQFFTVVWNLICPLVLGVVFAYMIDPIARLLERHVFPKIKGIKLGRKASVAIACIGVFCAMLILLILITPALISSLSMLLGNFDTYESTLLNIFNKIGFDEASLKTEMDTLFTQLKSMMPGITSEVVNRSAGTLSTLVNVGTGYVLAIYFMLDKEKILPWVISILEKVTPEEKYPEFKGFLSRCNEILLRYLSCSLLEALLVGVVNAILMIVFRMPMVVLISVLVGVTNLAPTFGPIIGGAIGTFVLFLMKPAYGVLFLIFTIIIQTIDSYVVKPILFGDTLGVSALWILIAITWGGRLFGVVGLLLSIPFAAIAQYALEEILFPKVREERILSAVSKKQQKNR